MLKLLNLKVKKISLKQQLLFTALLALILQAGMKIPEHFSIATTDSVGYHFFYYKKGKPEVVKKGDFVLFPLKTDIVENCNPCTVTKIVGCNSGQTLKTEGNQYFCDAAYLGYSKTESKKGVKVDPFVFNGKIPKGQFFATGVCTDSYDSKYYGLIEKENIQGVAIPLM